MPNFHNKYIFFKNFNHKERLPFILYFDLEAYLEPFDQEASVSTQTYTVKIERHKAFSVGYYLHCDFDSSLCEYKFYRNFDCLDWFIRELNEIAQGAGIIYNTDSEMVPMTEDELRDFENAICCHICEKRFSAEDIRTKDHRHYGDCKYRGSAHQSCNLLYKVPNF